MPAPGEHGEAGVHVNTTSRSQPRAGPSSTKPCILAPAPWERHSAIVTTRCISKHSTTGLPRSKRLRSSIARERMPSGYWSSHRVSRMYVPQSGRQTPSDANFFFQGYLRLGKISRLQKKNEFAWKVFNAGIDASASIGLPKNHPRVEVS